MDNLQNMVSAAQERKPTEFKKFFESEATQRIHDRINAMKPTVVASLINLPTGL